jgi:hypothetical protein
VVARQLLRDYLPARLVVQAADHSASTARPGTSAQLAGLVSLMRIESAVDGLGGRAMLNALSTAMFTLTLRLASEAPEAPAGLLALAGHPRLAPALAALFHEPCRSWTPAAWRRAAHTSAGRQPRIDRRHNGAPFSGEIGAFRQRCGHRPCRDGRLSQFLGRQHHPDVGQQLSAMPLPISCRSLIAARPRRALTLRWRCGCESVWTRTSISTCLGRQLKSSGF